MKATHLEQIAHDYERAEEHQKLMEDGIQKKKEVRFFSLVGLIRGKMTPYC